MRDVFGVWWGEWALRVAVAFEFAGHGIEALRVKEAWIPFFTTFGFSPELARTLMPFIGALDIALALVVIVRPVSALLLWMVFWGFFTALLRPLSGQSITEFIERGANWGAPLALWIMHRAGDSRTHGDIAHPAPLSDPRDLD